MPHAQWPTVLSARQEFIDRWRDDVGLALLNRNGTTRAS